MTYYTHQAIEAVAEPGDKSRECRVCGVAVTGVGDTLTHCDEQIRTIAVDREYLSAVRQAAEAAEQALSQITIRATEAERARAVAVAIYSAGLLRQRAVRPRAQSSR
jgi:hypothetical protein